MRGFISCKVDETLMKSQLVSSKWKIEIFMYECSSRQEPNYPVIISLEACDEWTSNTFVKKITYSKQKPYFKWLIKRNHTEDNEKNKIEVLKLRSWANFDFTGKFSIFFRIRLEKLYFKHLKSYFRKNGFLKSKKWECNLHLFFRYVLWLQQWWWLKIFQVVKIWSQWILLLRFISFFYP